MLWVVVSLLTLVEDVFSEEDKEAQSDPRGVLRQPSLSAGNLEQVSSIYTAWPEALGKHVLHSTIRESAWLSLGVQLGRVRRVHEQLQVNDVNTVNLK